MEVCLKPPFSNQAMAVCQWWQAVTLQCVFFSTIFEWLRWCHDLENSPDITHTVIGQEALHYSEHINTQSLSLKKGLSLKHHISILFYLLLTSEAEKWKIFTDMLSRKFCTWKAFFWFGKTRTDYTSKTLCITFCNEISPLISVINNSFPFFSGGLFLKSKKKLLTRVCM